MSVLNVVAQIVSVAWTLALGAAIFGQALAMLSGSAKADKVWRGAAAVHQELWIAAPPGLIFVAVDTWHGPMPWLLFFNALNLWNWWHYRDWPDENRWKRRGRKAKEAVSVRAGRLVVVPS